MKYTHNIKLPYLLYSLKSKELLPGITRGVPTHVETRTCRRNRALKKTFIKAVSPHTATKVFKRNKNLVWLVKNVGIVKLEEDNQLKHQICAMFTREFF